MRSSQRIRQTLQRYQRKPVTQQGILGNEVGVISVPNRTDFVYVRVAGLGTISIYNKRVPLIMDLPVDVGYDPLEPKNFQVLNIHRYPQGGGRGLVDVATLLHGKTHNWAGIDPVYIEKRQLMPLRPTPLGGMQVYVTREVTYYDDKAVVVTGQQLDLAPYVPATGSLMVLLYKDTDEIIKIRTGGVLKDIFTLALSDAPQAYPGTVPIALIRLYGGQTGIAEGYDDTDLIDVRQLFSPIFTSGTYSGVLTGTSSGGHIIQDEGSNLPARGHLNFSGAGVIAQDDAGNDATKILITGGGDVIGPATNTDNAIARWDGTNSKTLQNSLATVDDNGGVNIPLGQTFNIGGNPHSHPFVPIGYSIASCSNPPTENDFTNAFGAPATVHSGYVGIINKNGAGEDFYMGISDGTKWWYHPLAKALAVSIVAFAFLASDSFTDTNTTALHDHTMEVGDGWTEAAGTWTITSNKAGNSDSTGGIKAAIVDAEVADYRIRVVATMPTAVSSMYVGGLAVRYTDINNFWKIVLYTDFIGGVWVGKIQIVEKNGGNETIRATKDWVDKRTYPVELEVECNGNDITAWVEGAYSVTYSSAFNNTATKAGIFEQRDIYSAWIFDDFEIDPLPTYPYTRQGIVMAPSLPAEETTLAEPNVIYEDGIWKMWYRYGWDNPEIGYATSPDGITWTKSAENPLLSDKYAPYVFKVGLTYYMYVNITTWNRFDRYSSSDGLEWTLDQQGVMSVGGAGTWDASNLGNMCVWKEDTNDWRMIYEAKGASGIWKLGYATSTDGLTWSKSGSNPVLTANSHIGGPKVIKSGSYFYLFAGREGGGFARYRSDNLITWIPLPWATLVKRSGDAEGENSPMGQTADMEVVINFGTLYAFFTGSTDYSAASGNASVELATADARALDGW